MALREHKLKLEKASLKEEELMLIVNSAEINHQATQWAEQEASYG
jgi:hypothetical protein